MDRLEIPGYDVWGLLGEGGMSEVWLAKHRALAVPVIAKTMRRALRASEGERVLSEARLMARVASPQIVRALDAGQIEGGTPYLVQEYIDGLDLAELDKRRRSSLGVGLPLWLVCHVMTEVCTGLRAAHQAGVIHRDLKPSNVFGAPESGIRLGDFGIAVASTDAPKDSAGTLKFMAPEQFKRGEIGRFTDVWGAAATAFDLRYGYAPFKSVGDIVEPGVGPNLPAPQSPAEAYFQQVLRWMLAKDLRARPEDLTVPLHHFTMLARAVAPTSLGVSLLDAQTMLLGNVRIHFAVGDIAATTADAIISSANFEMKMRSGVGESLRRRGGDHIEREAMEAGERPLGTCIRTTPGELDAKHLFHAVGAWNEVSCIGRAFARALLMCDEHGCKSVAVPALGTGAARISTEMCAKAMMTTLRWHTMLGGTRLRDLTIWLDTEPRRRAFVDVAEEVFGMGEAGLLRGVDLGLPVDDAPVTPDAVTCLDANAGGSGSTTDTARRRD
jgi:eukaryotic-like serine/threonine-protein kinase